MPASIRFAELNDPAYSTALGHFQKGEWQPGLASLKGLAERFPHDPHLSAMVEENQLRANIDQDERQDRRRAVWRSVGRWVARLAVVPVLALAVWWGVQSYSLWFQNQALIAEQTMAAQAQAFALATKYADAQSMLRAGRQAEAQTLLNQIIAVDPKYPGVQTLMAQVQAR